MKKLFSFLAATLLLASTTYAQQSQPIPVDPAVRMGKLENGMTYYIRHNAEPQGQANFYIAQKVGSILEEENQRGLAHFLEHMCFNGTKHFPGNGVIKYCESIGVKFGENLNAYTSIDKTVYNIDNVPVGAIPTSVDSCLLILHDWANDLLLTDEDIDHERGVIHEEWRVRANATIRMLEKLLPMMYPVGDAHPTADGTNRYGHRMPIGLMSVVDNFPYKALRDYYHKWYRPDLQGIIVVGDIDVDQVEAKIRNIFGSIPAPVNPAERYYVQVPDSNEPLICMVTDKEQNQATNAFFFKFDPFPKEMRGDVNYMVYKYVMNIAGRMLSARLDEMRQSANPPFISAMAGDGDYYWSCTKQSFIGEVYSSAEDFSKAVTTVYREMLRAIRCGFTDSEYERAKAQVLADVEAAYNSRDKKKSYDYCQEYVNHFLTNEPIPAIDTEFTMIQQIANAVNAQMVSQMLAQIVSNPNNMTLMSMLPEKEGVTYPTKEEMAKQLAAVAAEELKPYVDAVSNEPLMSELPKAGRVVNTKAGVLGYKQYTLSNGATVYFRQTDFNPNEIVMTAYSMGGTSLYDESMLPDLKVVGRVMNVGGLGKFSMNDLRKALAGHKVSVNAGMNFYKEYVSSKTTPKDLELMMQLNYLTFTSMRTDRDAFESWKNRERAAIANRASDPSTAFQDTINKHLYVSSARVESMTEEELDHINYDNAMRIARERFANAGDFVFIITGAIDEQTLLPMIERYIASLPATKQRETAKAEVMEFRKGTYNKTFERKMDVPMVSNLFFNYADIKFSLKNKLSFDLALNALTVELLEEIREKEGGTYGIGAYGMLAPDPAPRDLAFMQILYQAAPDRYEYLNQRVRDIVAKFAAEGPSDENLAKGKEFFLKEYKEGLRENTYWAEAMETMLDAKVDMTLNYEQVLQSITRDDVRNILTQLLKQNNYSEIIMKGVAR